MAMPSSPRPMIWVQAGTASLPVFTEILKSLERTLVGVPVMAFASLRFQSRCSVSALTCRARLSVKR